MIRLTSFAFVFVMSGGCRDIGRQIAPDTEDTRDSVDTGQAQHSAEDSADDSGTLPECFPDEGEIQIRCPYEIPEEFVTYPTDSSDTDQRPIVNVRTGWFLPPPFVITGQTPDWLSNVKTELVPVAGALNCCVPSSINVIRPDNIMILRVSNSTDGDSVCHIVFGNIPVTSRQISDVKDPGWPWRGWKCEIPLPWTPPSWLYSANSPRFGEIPAGCEPYDPTEPASAHMFMLPHQTGGLLPNELMGDQP